jgi:hypothetical protein
VRHNCPLLACAARRERKSRSTSPVEGGHKGWPAQGSNLDCCVRRMWFWADRERDAAHRGQRRTGSNPTGGLFISEALHVGEQRVASSGHAGPRQCQPPPPPSRPAVAETFAFRAATQTAGRIGRRAQHAGRPSARASSARTRRTPAKADSTLQTSRQGLHPGTKRALCRSDDDGDDHRHPRQRRRGGQRPRAWRGGGKKNAHLCGELVAAAIELGLPALASNPYRLAAWMSRCGRDNPGSAPGEDIF